MPYNGSGLFVRVYNWVADKTNSIPITASRMDTEDSGFAAGLSNCVTRDGQGQMGADLVPATTATYNLGTPSNTWKNLSLSGTATIVGACLAAEFISTNGINAPSTSGTTVPIISVPAGWGVYLVSVSLATSGDPTNYNCTALFSTNGNSGKTTVLQTGGLLNITNSGLTIQAVQNSGGSAAMNYSIVRIAST